VEVEVIPRHRHRVAGRITKPIAGSGRVQSPPVASRKVIAMQKVEGSSPFIRF